MKTHYSVLIVGGGQAGLSVSYYLKQRNLDHLIFEKHQVAHSWQDKRWDSFCLVTPNWQCQLPGFPYQGDDPHGFMVKSEIVEYVRAYAKSFDAPVKEGVAVTRVQQLGDRFGVSTSLGEFTADQVVIAAGGYHKPRIPRLAERLPRSIHQIHSSQYRNPDQLPEGDVMVVGTGQSGCQIAEDLHLAGRRVHLCVGSAPRSPRRYRGKDVVDWLDQMGYYDMPIDEHPQKETVRHRTNHYLTGRDGGREIDLRQFATEGMQLYGRLQDIDGDRLYFKPDLKQNLDGADAVAESIKKTVDRFIEQQQLDIPPEAPYCPIWEPQKDPTDVAIADANIRSVIWSTGYHTNFRWIEVPVFDGQGYPCHDRGVTAVKGMYFIGLPWLYTWGSGRFSGVARDAQYIADHLLTKRKYQSPLLERINEMAIGS
ncbi:MSMEG_0569 family flavin-dependent oxidoreductase [Leptolyngbya iicbica]|uniref:MSMEG_0569 family flavin-dependent oxidoreductase n=2 Tax=Cyanophyceae TaxID=3028117 RepID=A0A4Q7EEF4_9CYAN|nr:MSMEG_0569 family flavin-dependent oxidoreductase [Leptolyngbya sp. LK]RZM81871.1 MSMEG_0569 family flavin-dependent oxidoreductase [Leptolyngbya sp. LK]